MAERLLNKVAVVTGAGGGMGRVIVRRFVGEGAKVVVFGRSRAALDEVAATAPARVLVIEGDVTRPGDLQRLVDDTVRRFGPVDVLLPAAGLVEAVPFEDASPETAQRQLDVNFLAPIETVRRFLPALSAGASVVFVTSALAGREWPGLTLYNASKAALSSFAETLAIEWAPRNIRVNCIAPGPTATPFWKTLVLTFDRLKGVTMSNQKRFNPDQLAQPDDVAEAALFLASDASRHISGQEIVVKRSATLP